MAQTHPRMWITADDLPRLRALATPANPMWEKGLKPALDRAVAIYDKDFFPGGQPNPSWPDPGIDNWVPRCTEALAEFFAFMSLVDPEPTARPVHAERAKRLLMHVIDEAEKGVDPDRRAQTPFRGAAFATFNRANYWGEAFGLTVDWIHAALSASDKAKIRKVFLRWAGENVRAATSGQEHPQPIGALNDPRLLADPQRLRWAANNYFTGHMRLLTMMSLAFDEADDPPLDPSAPATQLGNTLRSYLDDAVGAWLYQQYALYEEPSVAAAALRVPPAGLGAASGGLSPEGFLYGASIGSLHEALLALYTAGYRDPKKLGPQIGLIESAYWDRFADAFLHALTPMPERSSHHGVVYPMANFGETLRFWMTPDHGAGFASMAVHARLGGHEARLGKARWILREALEGGAEAAYRRVADIWGNSLSSLAILTFLAFDPEAAAPADPRPALPLVFHDRALGRVVARSAWTPDATMFDYKCSWLTIGHQFGDCNQIELYRKGEWLTRERSGYANDLVVTTPDYHNTLSIQNGATQPSGLQWFETVTWTRGGQWGLAQNAGDPAVRVSSGSKWLFAEGDATNLYNRRPHAREGQAVDVAHASRSVAWLKPDWVVVYDRAATRTEGRFKRFNLTFVGEPIIEGKRATVTTPGGQRLFVQTLLPEAATLVGSKAEAFNRLAEGEPSRFRLVVEDAKGPREVRFLHVLEGADAGASATKTMLLRSSAGTPFAGAAVGSLAVLFPVELATPFARVRYTVPASVKGQLVTGLAPGGRYEVTMGAKGAEIEVTIAEGGARRADEAGVLALGSLEGP
ncbi:Serine/threonine kinase associate protein KapC [Minicystis rosea]|nr:Serine/threonine kinase associate protein KapC [Minicystis rosea]